MIKPVNLAIGNNQHLNNLNKRDKILDDSYLNTNIMELSNYKVGQSMLNCNNISFRNLEMPVEITDKFIAKSDSRNHLNLPNIHVYENPNTNLQVFVNADNNIETFDNSELCTPKYSIIIENNDYEKHDLLKEKLLSFLLNQDNADVFGSSFCIGIYSSKNMDLLNTIKEINQEVFNKKINNKDLEEAKDKLKAFLTSPEYFEENNLIKELYSNNDLKSNEELITEIENISTNDMQNYYEEYFRNSSVRVFLTISKEYFEQNKHNLLRQINSDTDLKFLNCNIADSNTLKFVGNVAIVDKTRLKIPTKAENTKDDATEKIAINILNSDKNFRKKYSLNRDSFSIPIELKNNSPAKYHCNLCVINLNGDKNIEDLSFDLNEICKKDLSLEIEKQKNEIKEKLKQTFTDKKLDLIKHFELISYSSEIFSLYEIIDSINEDDIKQYYKDIISIKIKGVN